MKYNTDKIIDNSNEIIKATNYRFDIINEKINLLRELVRLIAEKTNSNNSDEIVELFKNAFKRIFLIEKKYLKQN